MKNLTEMDEGKRLASYGMGAAGRQFATKAEEKPGLPIFVELKLSRYCYRVCLFMDPH